MMSTNKVGWWARATVPATHHTHCTFAVQPHRLHHPLLCRRSGGEQLAHIVKVLVAAGLGRVLNVLRLVLVQGGEFLAELGVAVEVLKQVKERGAVDGVLGTGPYSLPVMEHRTRRAHVDVAALDQ